MGGLAVASVRTSRLRVGLVDSSASEAVPGLCGERVVVGFGTLLAKGRETLLVPHGFVKIKCLKIHSCMDMMIHSLMRILHRCYYCNDARIQSAT